MRKNKGISTNDKNSLILLGAFGIMLLLSFIFFNVSRMLPLEYLIIFVILFEFIIVVPSLVNNYYKLHNQTASASRFIPVINMISIFPGRIAILTCVSFLISAILAILALAPLPVSSLEKLDVLSTIQYNAIGWLILSLLITSIILGVGFTSVYKHVLELKEEYYHGKKSKMELSYFFMLYLPFLRCFALYNMNNVIKIMLSTGYRYGVDYSKLEIEEE